MGGGPNGSGLKASRTHRRDKGNAALGARPSSRRRDPYCGPPARTGGEARVRAVKHVHPPSRPPAMLADPVLAVDVTSQRSATGCP